MRSDSERALELELTPWADITHTEEVVMWNRLVSEPGHTAWRKPLAFRYSAAELDNLMRGWDSNDPCPWGAYIPAGEGRRPATA